MLIKSVVNKNKNNNYYNIYLGKDLYKDTSNAQYFINEGFFDRCCISLELTFLEELMLTKEVH